MSPKRSRSFPKQFEQLSEGELDVLERVAQLLRRIDYGTVVLVIHDGKVVQVEMAEKFRLQTPGQR